MPAPHEILAAPLTLYYAEIGTDFPEIDDLPADFDPAWAVVGAEGDANYDEDGVTASHSEEVFDFVPAGRTMPVKRFRTSEDFKFGLNLVDLSPEMYAFAMNGASITTVSAGAGQAGYKKFSLIRGDQVNSYAVVARGMSSIDNDLNMQYNLSKAFISTNGDVQFTRGKVAMLPLQILGVHHADDDVIECVVMSTEAS